MHTPWATHLAYPWHQQLRHAGRTWSDVDAAPDRASRWLTSHALRVLAWWDTQP